MNQAAKHERAIWHGIPFFSAAASLAGCVVIHYREPRELADSDMKLLESMGRLARAALEHDELYAQLEHQSRHDALTQLPNRIAFEERLQHALTAASRYGRRVAVLFIDLDRFKQINDSLGHKIGDGLLRQVSRQLETCLRKSDTLARIGGDEFTMVLSEIANHSEAERVAERVLEVLRPPFEVEGYELFTSGSVGIAIYPEHGVDFVTLLKRADHAMYSAKARGKDQYHSFDPQAVNAAPESVGMTGILRRALELDQFELHYQPLFRITGELAAVEALIRLRRTGFGLVAPDQFIPVAEESGLIIPIGYWVIRQACRQIVKWQAAGYPLIKIAVNVSAIQLVRADFAETVARILKEEGVNASLLELELTETEVMRNWEESSYQMRKLRDLGLSISIDDFGTGYSSLSYMHRLRVDNIKIDRSFIRDIDGKESSLPVLRSIVSLAHQLGLIVTAEGIETEEQLLAVRDLDCDMVQGYLLQRPVPARSLEAVLFRRDENRLATFPLKEFCLNEFQLKESA